LTNAQNGLQHCDELDLPTAVLRSVVTWMGCPSWSGDRHRDSPPLRCSSAIDDGVELEGGLVSTKPREDPRHERDAAKRTRERRPLSVDSLAW